MYFCTVSHIFFQTVQCVCEFLSTAMSMKCMFRREKCEELQELSEQYKNIAAGKILHRSTSDNLLKGNKRFNNTVKTVFRLDV